jgi:hypothetical protein
MFYTTLTIYSIPPFSKLSSISDLVPTLSTPLWTYENSIFGVTDRFSRTIRVLDQWDAIAPHDPEMSCLISLMTPETRYLLGVPRRPVTPLDVRTATLQRKSPYRQQFGRYRGVWIKYEDEAAAGESQVPEVWLFNRGRVEMGTRKEGEEGEGEVSRCVRDEALRDKHPWVILLDESTGRLCIATGRHIPELVQVWDFV